jgi:hypothetical protein
MGVKSDLLLRMTELKQNGICDGKSSTLNSGNALYQLVQNLLSVCAYLKTYNSTCYFIRAWDFICCSEEETETEEIGPKTDELTGQWRKLHTKELHNLCFFWWC